METSLTNSQDSEVLVRGYLDDKLVRTTWTSLSIMNKIHPIHGHMLKHKGKASMTRSGGIRIEFILV